MLYIYIHKYVYIYIYIYLYIYIYNTVVYYFLLLFYASHHACLLSGQPGQPLPPATVSGVHILVRVLALLLAGLAVQQGL